MPDPVVHGLNAFLGLFGRQRRAGRHGGQRLRVPEGLGGSQLEPEPVGGNGTQFSQRAGRTVAFIASGPPVIGGHRTSSSTTCSLPKS
jgi:hypothetical protein